MTTDHVTYWIFGIGFMLGFLVRGFYTLRFGRRRVFVGDIPKMRNPPPPPLRRCNTVPPPPLPPPGRVLTCWGVWKEQTTTAHPSSLSGMRQQLNTLLAQHNQLSEAERDNTSALMQSMRELTEELKKAE